MARKTNVDWYRERLAVIEQEFGLKWLAKKAAPGVTGHGGNPIPRRWADANKMLDSARDERRAEITPELAELFDLASDLETARTLPGYAQAITPKRLKSQQYEKECYVVHVAALGVRSGYEVEFVPTSPVPGERTPDLAMKRDRLALQVECKRKDDYVKVSPALPTWTQLEEKLLALSHSITCDYEVIVCAIGTLHADSVQEIARMAGAVVANNGEGEFSGGMPDCVVLVRRNPPRPPGVDGLLIPAWQNPSAAAGTMTVGKDGELIYGPMLRATLYVIDSHRLDQLLSSFRQARSQIDPAGAGVIYIGVDTSLVPAKDQELYFRALPEWIARQFRPNVNTRIAAVVLTGGTAEVTITPNGGWHRTLRGFAIARNPYFLDSAQLIIPGESFPEVESVTSD